MAGWLACSRFNVVSGILLAYLSNFIIATRHLGLNEWRWEFGVAILPSLLFLVFLYGIPRSPRWLVTTNQNYEAQHVLELMGSPDSAGELQEIIDSIHLERQYKEEPLFNRRYLLPILLAIAVGLFNQLSGINAILYYSNFIFVSAGFSSISGGLQTVVIGIVNLLSTLLGMSLMDKVGRKTLLLIGSVGTFVALAGVTAIFFTNQHQNLLVWLLMAYIFFFAISQGSVIWVYISEIFPNRVRSKGQSLGSSAHWLSAAVITLVFPVIAKKMGPLPLLSSRP